MAQPDRLTRIANLLTDLDTEGRARLQINGIDPHDLVEATRRWMVERNARNHVQPTIYRVGERRVELRDGVAITLDRSSMCDLLISQISFYNVRGKAQLEEPMFPPHELVAALLNHHDWTSPDARELVVTTVLRCPTILPDGRVVSSPGYSALDELFLAFPDDLVVPVIPDWPTLTQARACAKALLDWLNDFAFADEASRVNALGMVLSVPLRPLFGPGASVPMYVIDAPLAGSGKGLFVDLVSVIASGEAAPQMIADADTDEYRKRATVIARQAPAILHLDNLDKVFGNGALASMLTNRGRTLERVLGTSDATAQPIQTLFALSGNNVLLKGDTLRRVVYIRLNPRLEQPHVRTADDFERPELLKEAGAERGTLLGYVLTIGRYWTLHQGDINLSALPGLGSFEAFNRVIGGVLQLLGYTDWLGNREEFRADQDEDADQWVTWLECIQDWQQALPEGWTARELAEVYTGRLMAHKAVRDAWPGALIPRTDETLERVVNKLGYGLRKHRDRPYAGRCLQKCATGAHAKVARWQVVDVVPPPSRARAKGNIPPITSITSNEPDLSSKPTADVEVIPSPAGGDAPSDHPHHLQEETPSPPATQAVAEIKTEQITGLGGDGGDADPVSPRARTREATKRTRKPKPAPQKTTTEI